LTFIKSKISPPFTDTVSYFVQRCMDVTDVQPTLK